MKKLKTKISISSVLYFVPMLVFAQGTGLSGLFTKISGLLNAIIPLIIGLAFVVFLWGVYKYIVAPGPEEKSKGKDTIIYGIIGLFVMLAAWGIVNILTQTFELDTSVPTGTDIPGIPER